ncbi:hypothetical protein WKV44_06430 [Spirochaetia bacterium 38H-sp]|uniref:Uncharacterized protein n=1 Tax=Rarispira pelagica TaxID=3141764 RepID=A0ABU9UBY1_9SPIR
MRERLTYLILSIFIAISPVILWFRGDIRKALQAPFSFYSFFSIALYIIMFVGGVWGIIKSIRYKEDKEQK